MLFSSKVYWGQVLKNTERAVKPEFLFNALKSPVNDAGSFLSKRGQRLCYGNIEIKSSGKNHQAESQADGQGGDLIHVHGVFKIGLTRILLDL